MITFEQIQTVNEGLTSIDVKGKDYIMVPQRVKAFRMLFPAGFIKTDIVSLENGVCVMKTKVGYYENGQEIVLSTGLAYEKESNGFINRTSYIENCETSSVGRALGFMALGIDGGGICSAEELVNAVSNQQREAKSAGTPVQNKQEISQDPSEKTIDIAELRQKLDYAIKSRTKDMTIMEKTNFVNEIIKPTLQGERNWRLCNDVTLLQSLLTTIMAA